MGSFHYKRQAPGGVRQERARVSETPACLGRRFWLADKGKPETVGRAQNTRLAMTRSDSLGRGPDMEHERGAFKVNREMRFTALKRGSR